MESDMDAGKDEIIKNYRQTMTGFEFNLQGISTKIKIKTNKIKKTGKVTFVQSHFIHTPKQCGPYMTDHSWAHSEHDAVERVLSDFTDYYKRAIEAGHEPKESWLVMNGKFLFS
jgi:hypothetical protein